MENGNAQYKRIWRKFEGKDGSSYDVVISNNPTTHKASANTIQTEKEANGVEITRSAFVVLEDETVKVSRWSGTVGEAHKKYERTYLYQAEELDSDRKMIQEAYENAIRIPQGSVEIARLSDFIMDYVKMIEKKHPERQGEGIHDTYP